MTKSDPYFDLMCDDHYHAVKVEPQSVLVFRLGLKHQMIRSRMNMVREQAQKLLNWCRQKRIEVYPAVLVFDRDESLESISVAKMRDAGFVPESELKRLNQLVDALCERLAFQSGGEKTPSEIRASMLRSVMTAPEAADVES